MKKILKRTLPRAWTIASAAWRHARQQWFDRKMKRISQAYVERYGLVVRNGPFAGMSYVDRAFSSMVLPKLIGSYEAELHETLDVLFERKYAQIVDVGCAEGYYAVGLALRFRSAQVHAFDLNEAARLVCREVASANNVSGRINIAGGCDPERLSSLPLEGALLFCDCDGYEIELLDPHLVPGLSQCDLIVETHDCYNPVITSTLLERFQSTHLITLIDSAPRHPENYSELRFLSLTDQALAVNEVRPFQQWACMMAR